MAFFQKLKERLFKSSSKLEEGLDALIEDGARRGACAPAAAAPEERPGLVGTPARAGARAACSTTPCSRASRSS